MKTTICVACDSPDCHEVEYSSVIQGQTVNGLLRWKCGNCGAEFSDSDQARLNLATVKRSRSEEPGTVSKEEILALRKRYKLTQRVAARIFGGGANAFSKYENGEVLQAEAMDNLLWLATKYPGIIASLAGRRRIELTKSTHDACGVIYNVYSNVSMPKVGGFSTAMSFHASHGHIEKIDNTLTVPESANDHVYSGGYAVQSVTVASVAG